LAQDRITLQIRPPERVGDVLLSDFNREINAFVRLFEQADLHLSGRGRRTVEFRVVDLHHSAATVVVSATPLNGEQDERGKIAKQFFDGLREIVDHAQAPKNFSSAMVGALRDIAGPVGLGVAETLISWGDFSASISIEFKKRVQDVPLPDDVEDGDIDGMMEMVNLHNKANRFRLYPIIGPNQLTCEFDEKLLSGVKAGLGRYVNVSGKMRYRYGERHPYMVVVSRIEILDDEALPTFEGLRGIAPGLTGGVPSELYVRQVRDEWG